ncbi:MAG TPA: hypothetical protein VNQ90_19335 [Chthoniobacteraceae bacterium]|nr:hypothetical protein [Chthoniobacteraceae bacterium]
MRLLTALPRRLKPAFVIGILLFCLSVSLGTAEGASIPDAKVPEYRKLKELYLQTPLVRAGQPQAVIVTGGKRYREEARRLQSAIEKETQVLIPILADGEVQTPFTRHMILLGNRSTNKVLSFLYDRFYAMTDLKYPGAGGFELRSVHNPLGNGCNGIIVGGSDEAGVSAATERLIGAIERSNRRKNSLTLGWLLQVKQGKELPTPTSINDLPTWQASMRYPDTRFFGWNGISRRMALYYMTGDESHLTEMLRLSFPDAAAKADLARDDGESFENRNDPLAFPYHYCATRMILYWDLIEESPFFSHDDRLRITNAFARQLAHRLPEKVYELDRPAENLGTRHDNYSALSLYTLARYFEKDYADPAWKQALLASSEYYFAPLSKPSPWLHGERDNLYWYGTSLAPVLDYLLLGGDPHGYRNGEGFRRLLREQEVLWNGASDDPNLGYCALDYFNKAAYLTGDGRWLHYRKRLLLDVDIPRADQSFWPAEPLQPKTPADLPGRWSINTMPPAQYSSRHPGFPASEAFSTMSYRSTADSGGDYVLLDGMNAVARNEFHNFAILDLRVGGKTLLKGYLNQVRTTVDGMVEPAMPLNAALKHHSATGESVFATATVPGMPAGTWTRRFYMRKGKYGITADTLSFSRKSDKVTAAFHWQNGRTAWRVNQHSLSTRESRITPADSLRAIETDGKPVLTWYGSAQAGKEQTFFSLISPAAGSEGATGSRVAPNAALFLLPEPVLVSSGAYAGVQARLAVREEGHFSATGFLGGCGITTTAPVDLDWDLEHGRLQLFTPTKVKVTIAGNPTTLDLTPGHHELPAVPIPASLREMPDRNLTRANPAEIEKGFPHHDLPAHLPALKPTFQLNVGGPFNKAITVNEGGKGIIYVAAGERVLKLGKEGNILDELKVPSPIQAMHWWADVGLLVVGTADQKCLAYQRDGSLKWTFQSEMAPEIARSGKVYWYNTAKGQNGVRGLGDGIFIRDQPQLFVGSACTLEILDAEGRLLRRLPQRWGIPTQFQTLRRPDGSIDLIAGRIYTSRPIPKVINNRTLDPGRTVFHAVPSGHTLTWGWMVERTLHVFAADLDGDGEEEVISDITGAWNRISTWKADGTPLHTVNFGPGPSAYAGQGVVIPLLIRDSAVVTWKGEDRAGIVTALSSGLVVLLDGSCKVLWSRQLPSPPLHLLVQDETIVVALENGSILSLDRTGRFLSHTKAEGKITALAAGPNGSFLAGTEHSVARYELADH